MKENLIHYKLDGREYLKLLKIADEFLQKGKTEEIPKFVIIMGGVAAGKSTTRKRDYSDGYVFIDGGAIYMKLTENETKKTEKDTIFCQIIGEILISNAIEQKRNIVIELIGDKYENVDKIIQEINKRGYNVKVEAIVGDIADCYQRHLKQAKEGRDDISSFHTQDSTMEMFNNYFDKIIKINGAVSEFSDAKNR